MASGESQGPAAARSRLITHTRSAPRRYEHSHASRAGMRRPCDARSLRSLCSSSCDLRLRRIEQDVQQRPAAAFRRGSSVEAPAAHDSHT